LWYLQGTKEFDIWYTTETNSELLGYTDSDLAGSTDDMKEYLWICFLTRIENVLLGVKEASYSSTINNRSRVRGSR